MHFYKYQGTGNDFILFDNRNFSFQLSRVQIAHLCNRHFGIGADGLMLLESLNGYDFKMVYYNADGAESSMCGNGGRCITAFAQKLGVIQNNARFIAIDGEHESEIKGNIVRLKMSDVKEVEKNKHSYFLNTGSPHYVEFVQNIKEFPVFEKGREIRYNDYFFKEGTNVNFIENENEHFFVRTYERGVENETLSCGTGVTAAALVAAIEGKSTTNDYCLIKSLGGSLKVYFTKLPNNCFNNIWLEGGAEFVFEGDIFL